jgi:cytochrome c-type biogenesis protein CcmF
MMGALGSAELGYMALVWATAMAGYSGLATAIGARWRQPRLLASGYHSTMALAILVTLAVIAMEVALLTHDFRLAYVARHGSRATPVLITAISLWAALEGSILFWAWLLSLFTAAVVLTYYRQQMALLPYVVPVLAAVLLFFLGLMLGPANPFRTVFPVPPDGPGPNPLLQNHPFMAIHPPLLYLGFVGLTVPFAFAIAALVTGRLGEEWIVTTRRWTLVAWSFLTGGIIMGGWWSYEVLGWGGYWAWDPVENASFMPWLPATAFLHSVMVQERRQMLKVWNLSLIILAFSLTLFGTFLTRSGVLSSVHAFSPSVIGPVFLGFLAVVLLGAAGLLVWRGEQLKSAGQVDAAVSRESAFLLNNLLFLGFTFTVFLGTVFPLLAEAVRGVKVSVGAPFFDQVTVPIILALLFLMGIGPFIAWQRASWPSLRRHLQWPLAAGLLTAALLLLLGMRSLAALVAFALAVFVMVGTILDYWRGIRIKRRHQERGLVAALRALLRQNRQRYGGLLVHVGVVLVAIGVTASSAFQQETQAFVRRGETVSIGDYTLRFEALTEERQPHRNVMRSRFTLLRQGQEIATLQPALHFYVQRSPSPQEPIGSPAVHSTPLRDLYVVLAAFQDDGAAVTVRVLLRPLVMWIWLGGGIMLAGAVVALLPGRQRRRARPGQKLTPTGALS